MAAHYPGFFDLYQSEKNNQAAAFGLDFTSFHSPADIAAPSVDSFEYDLDLLSQDNDLFHLEVTQVNSAYSQPLLPSFGPGSAITQSSESSAHDTLSFYSEPFNSPPSTYSFNMDDIDFNRMDFSSAQSAYSALDSVVDRTSFGPLPPTPPRSPPSAAAQFERPVISRTSFSDYNPPKKQSIASDLYSTLGFSAPVAQSTVTPSHISNMIQSNISQPCEESKGDSRKKYRCSSCPRAFARAYNLKTHMATHDPNRLKPHVCPHGSCGRSFSRKHDLGRHLISIHRDDPDFVSHKPSIGVEKGPRGWCDGCGKGFVGRNKACSCHEVET